MPFIAGALNPDPSVWSMLNGHRSLLYDMLCAMLLQPLKLPDIPVPRDTLRHFETLDTPEQNIDCWSVAKDHSEACKHTQRRSHTISPKNVPCCFLQGTRLTKSEMRLF